MSHSDLRKPIRRGMTMIELVVVLSILVLLMALAIPAMRGPLGSRRIREASRSINVYFGSARVRAKQLGRSCGVVIERMEGQPECSMLLRQAEVPPPYAGDLMDSVVRLRDYTDHVPSGFNRSSYWPDGSTVVKAFIRDGDFSSLLLRRGDLMQINRQGPYYKIARDRTAEDSNDPLTVQDYPIDDAGYIVFDGSGQDDDDDGFYDTLALTLVLAPAPGTKVPWPKAGPGMAALSTPQPFEILRQPMTSAASPLELPAGAVIDLQFSGTDDLDVLGQLGWQHAADDTGDSHWAANQPVTIMFSPNGSVERVIYYQHVHDHANDEDAFVRREVTIVEPIYLLVGKREHVPFDMADLESKANWQDDSCLWVSVNAQSGLVTSAEIARHTTVAPPAGVIDPYYADPAIPDSAVKVSRHFARQAQNMGGR